VLKVQIPGALQGRERRRIGVGGIGEFIEDEELSLAQSPQGVLMPCMASGVQSYIARLLSSRDVCLGATGQAILRA
jgi:hypothetical protein